MNLNLLHPVPLRVIHHKPDGTLRDSGFLADYGNGFQFSPTGTSEGLRVKLVHHQLLYCLFPYHVAGNEVLYQMFYAAVNLFTVAVFAVAVVHYPSEVVL